MSEPARSAEDASATAQEAYRLAREAFAEIETVEDRMKSDMDDALAPVLREMKNISKKLGEPPAPDGTGGKGILGTLAALDKRIQPFEKMQERAVGGFLIGSPLLVVIWFLTQDPVKHALGMN